MNPHMLPKCRSEMLMQEMKHLGCRLRIASFIPGYQCAPDSTVVGCHLSNLGKGLSTKTTDLAVAAGCLRCHDLVDGRDNRVFWIIENYPVAFYERLLVGLIETHAMLAMNEIITVKGAEYV